MRHRRIFYKVQSSEFKVQIVLRAMWQGCSEPTVLVRQGKNNVALVGLYAAWLVATSRTIRKARTACKKLHLFLPTCMTNRRFSSDPEDQHNVK